MTYKLLITDLDNTLLNSQRRLSARTHDAFAQAKRAGKWLTFATGRNYSGAQPMIDALKPNAPIILYNGSRIVEPETGKILYAQNLPNAHARAAFEVNARHHIHISMYLNGDIYVETLTQEALDFTVKEPTTTCHPVGDLAAFLGNRDPVKLLLIAEPERLIRFAEDYAAVEPHVPLVRSEIAYLEILAPGVCKGNALPYMANYLGISVAEMIVVGDNPNDLELVRDAGLGVAVANAHPDVKSVADVLTDSNDDDGVAKVIETYLL